ncbi:expansin EXLX1 family cellulose-binding protein, partial [Micromonospora sp. KC721]|uniref:expansin EXLX1 family cellulose-binding protein n=1 Tax=Micromonospora sp. KC721 TaxID=2530380 RepID=UPI001052FB4F
LATVLGLSLALRSGAAPACAAPARVAAPLAGGAPLIAVPPLAAAPPVGGAVHKGKATLYDAQGLGNCSYPTLPANRLYVALGPSEYGAAAACGGSLDVTGPRGTVRVLVTDRCPECAPGHLDLSREAFARIADPVQGIVPISYRAVVDPPLPGPLTFRIKEGASQYWFAVLVGDHGNPLRSVEVRQGGSGSFRPAARQDYNYWLIDSGAGLGPYTVRVTDVYGHRTTATGIRLAPGQTQRSTVRMYGAAPAAGGGAPAAGGAAPGSSGDRTAAARRASSPGPSVSPSATVPARPSSGVAADITPQPDATATALAGEAVTRPLAAVPPEPSCG